MEEERYLEIFPTPSKLGLNLKAIALLNFKENYMKKEIQGKTMTNIKKIH